jgi:O-6-methylguanine DNA methyltransferase
VGVVVADWTERGLARLRWDLWPSADAPQTISSQPAAKPARQGVFCSVFSRVAVDRPLNRSPVEVLHWNHRCDRRDSEAVGRIWERWRAPLEAWGASFWRADPAEMNAALWEPDGLLDLELVSPFALRVLQHLSKVRFGERVSYGELARAVGKPGGARGVAQALARNRWPVLLPCHRVVASDGSLGGYSGVGGVAAKRWLLDRESSGTPQFHLFG